MTTPNIRLELGVKTDPIQYRYSYEWLFRLMAEEGVRHAQLGTFFEIYQLPDEFFVKLKKTAADFEVSISSIFTAHRELGGFFREEPGFVQTARKNFARLIQIGAIVGARSVGCNPGAVLRDRMGTKAEGLRTYLDSMKDLMAYARQIGVETVAIEPMSCLAEPPTLPDEIRDMAETLLAHHRDNFLTTSRIGYCVDVAHGYADRVGRIVHDHLELLLAALPYTSEIHLKNTDARYHSTFGFTEPERAKGVIDIPAIRSLLEAEADRMPVRNLIGYLEIGGPKLGRDDSDHLLENQLRESLRFLKSHFEASGEVGDSVESKPLPVELKSSNGVPHGSVKIAPSMMCADQLHFAESVRNLERCGADLLHLDIMDAGFAPNLPLGFELVRQLRPITDLPLDVHLMVEDNDFFVNQFASMGVDTISVHVESALHLDRTLSLIRSHGVRAGAALNPHTPLSALDHILDKLDFILLMTVNPGYAGQKLVPSTLRKIADCRRLLDERGVHIPIEVDGNVSFEHIPKMVAAGADILVAGSSSVFHPRESLMENFQKTRRAIRLGLERRPRETVEVSA